MNRDWAAQQLTDFIAHTTKPVPGTTGQLMQITPGQKHQLAQVVEQILDRVLPDWRGLPNHPGSDGYNKHRAAAHRAIAQLAREDELRENLGEAAPQLDAQRLHRWVWEPAKLLWRNGHFGEAVGAAARQLNAEAQAKLGRRDTSEWRLIADAFRLEPPARGHPRLRLMTDDGGDTYRSIHEGAASFARGCYMAVRNPGAHAVIDELPEHEALEQLSAFSLLAALGRSGDRGIGRRGDTPRAVDCTRFEERPRSVPPAAGGCERAGRWSAQAPSAGDERTALGCLRSRPRG